MRKSWPRLVQWLLVLMVPFALLGASLRIVTGHWLVRWEYHKEGFPADPYGLTREERVALAEVCVDYLATGANLSLLADLRLPEGGAAFDERELEHMEDVQQAYGYIVAAGVAATAIIAASGAAIHTTRFEERRRIPAGLLGGSLLSLGLLVGVGATMLLSWDRFFVTFHRVLFVEGTWTFAYSDTLIRLFPVRFWMDVGGTLVGVLAGGALLVGGAAWAWRRRS